MVQTEEKSSLSKELRHKMVVTIVTTLIVIALVALAGFVFFSPRESEVIGHVEVDEIRISGKVPGRISEYLVEEGQMVRKGDTLVRIYSPEVYAKREQAEAMRASAQALNRSLSGGSPAEMQEAAHQMWQSAKVTLDVAQSSFRRVENLYKEGVVSAQKYDQARALVKSAEAAEAAAKNRYELSRKGVLSDRTGATRGLVDNMDAMLKEVDLYVQEGALTSPLDGRVTDIVPHVGELVGTGSPVMNVTDPTSCYVVFALSEDRLPGIHRGTTLRGTIPALGGKECTLRVVHLKDMGIYSVRKAKKPTGQIDFRTFEVKAELIDEIEDLEPGMSVVIDRSHLK